MVFLAILYQQIFPVEQGAGIYQLVGGGHLLLVDADTASGNGATCLTLGGEDGRCLTEQVDGGQTRLEGAEGDFKNRNTFEDRKERFLIHLLQRFGSPLAKQDLRSFYGKIVGFATVYHYGDFLGQALLQGAGVGGLGVLVDQSSHFLTT